MRKVIFHYHLFKNAGTSFDDTLIRNFPADKWVTKEFPPGVEGNKRKQAEWVQKERQAQCFSSHTAFLNQFEIPDTKVYPVIFMRHPIDRIVSAYSFERNQGGDTFGAVLARNTSLGGYIETRLAMKFDRQCRNFHVDKYSKLYMTDESELERAKRAVRELDLVGDVGNYNESLSRFETFLKAEGFNSLDLVPVQKNVSRKSKSIEQKMDEFRNDIGSDMFDVVLKVNEDDLALYEYMKEIKGFS